MDTESSTPEDPVSILRARSEAEAAEAAKKAAADKATEAERAEQNRLNQLKVPEMVDELFDEINASYPVLREVDLPQLEARAQLVPIADETQSAPPPPRTWWRQLLNSRQLPSAVATKDIACWQVSWGMVRDDGAFLYIFVAIETGYIYGRLTRQQYAEPLDRDFLLKSRYDEVKDLLDRVKEHRQRAVDLREERIRREQWEQHQRESIADNS